MKRADIRVGISGWRYAPWRGTFYPKTLTQARELEYASRHVRSIEINGSFYSTQTPGRYRHWYAQTPNDFVFAVKCPRYITHIRRLKDVEAPLGNFFGSGVLFLREKLGPFLWQLPPNFRFEPDVVENFLRQLPKSVSEAVTAASAADRLTPEFPDGSAGSNKKLRHALEVRHHSFENPEFVELLRKYNVALVFADTAGKWPYIEDVTADFIYIRLHGEEEIYASGYEEPSLEFWKDRLSRWRQGRQPKDALTLTDLKPELLPRDIYVYFDNDRKVRAPVDAERLSQMVR